MGRTASSGMGFYKTFLADFNMERTHIPIPKPTKQSKLTRGGRIKPVSAKRAKLNKIYSALRKKFLEDNPLCEHWICELYHSTPEEIRPISSIFQDNPAGVKHIPKSTDVHHRKGRGKYLLDVSTWMAVSREGHQWIHANPKESYEKGYMLPR